MKFVPLADRLVVEPTKIPEMQGGIFIPEGHRKGFRSNTGTIVALGAATSTCLTLGTLVVFGPYSGSDITIDGKLFMILREEEVLGYHLAE